MRGGIHHTPHTHTQHALTYGEYQMNQHMEHNKANQDPIHPLWQFSLGQFNRKENGHNWKDRDQLELYRMLLLLFNLLARMCARLPPNQCPQLKYGRFLSLGPGRNNAPMG